MSDDNNDGYFGRVCREARLQQVLRTKSWDEIMAEPDCEDSESSCKDGNPMSFPSPACARDADVKESSEDPRAKGSEWLTMNVGFV